MKTVAMIGVGKLGQDCAEVMAQYYDVVGYDVEPRSPNFPMRATIEEAMQGRDIIFIAAPTPHDSMYGGETPTSHLPNKDFDYTIVTSILQEVNKYANQNQLVVLISTVLPGTVRRELRPCITNARFVYNPYLIAMGTVKYDMVNPEMIIIGTEDGSTTGDAKELIDFYEVMMQNNPRIEVGTWDEAEAIKIFYNTFISTKLALVNMVQDVAERNGNMNVDIVTKALADSTYRIMGPAYMKAGLGDAGACHPRDNIALRYMAENLNLGYDLFDSIMTAREIQAENMALRCLKNGTNITIVGKAYKPGVPYINGSASMLVGHYIEKHGGNVNYYDLNTGDIDMKSDWTDVYLIGYWEGWVEDTIFPTNTTVIDPWRKYNGKGSIQYGNTRETQEYIEPGFYDEFVSQWLNKLLPELKPYYEQIKFIYANYNSEFALSNYTVETVVNYIIDEYNKGKRYFFFDGYSEPIIYHNIKKIHNIIDQVNKQVDTKFFYLTGCVNGEEVYEQILTDYNTSRRLNIIASRFFESGIHHHQLDWHTKSDYDNLTVRTKKFLSFNRMPRHHRMKLLDFFFENNLIEQGYVSFCNDFNYDDGVKSHIENYKDDFVHLYRNEHLLPLNVNATQERNNPADIIPDDEKYFDNSYFSIVTETQFYSKNSIAYNSYEEPNIFPSEKTYKPIALLHPFIMIGRPKFLSTLREHGYKTFHPYIDESYDDVTDDDQRLNMILAEIKRLIEFTDEEFKQWMQQVKPIVEHNKKFMFHNDDYHVTKDILKYFQ